MQYLILTLASALFSLQFVFMALYQRKFGKRMSAGLLFGAVTGISTCLIFLCAGGFKVSFDGTGLLFALGMSALVVLLHVVEVKITAEGNVLLLSTSLMMGGMALPAVYGFCVLGEPLSVCKGIGIGLVFVELILPLFFAKRQKVRAITVLLCAVAFAANGSVSILSKSFSLLGSEMSSQIYIAWYSLFAAALSGILLAALPCRKEVAPHFIGEEETKWFKRAAVVLPFTGIGYSALSGTGNFILLKLAETIDASLLYPLNTCETILFSPIFGFLFFREKLTVSDWIGLVLSVAAFVLFLF